MCWVDHSRVPSADQRDTSPNGQSAWMYGHISCNPHPKEAELIKILLSFRAASYPEEHLIKRGFITSTLKKQLQLTSPSKSVPAWTAHRRLLEKLLLIFFARYTRSTSIHKIDQIFLVPLMFKALFPFLLKVFI